MNGRNRLRDYYSQHIDNDTLFFNIDTREELQQLEIEEFGNIGNGINWDKWDEVVQRTQDILKELPTRAKGLVTTLYLVPSNFLSKNSLKFFKSLARLFNCSILSYCMSIYP